MKLSKSNIGSEHQILLSHYSQMIHCLWWSWLIEICWLNCQTFYFRWGDTIDNRNSNKCENLDCKETEAIQRVISTLNLSISLLFLVSLCNMLYVFWFSYEEYPGIWTLIQLSMWMKTYHVAENLLRSTFSDL